MKHFKQYIGFVIGALYGLIVRFFAEQMLDDGGVFTITFLYITPIIISVIPIFFASTEIYKSKLKSFSYPFVSVFLFFIFALVTRVEDVACIVFMAAPAVLAAGPVGLLAGVIKRKMMKNKHLYSIALLPFILIPIENIFPDTTDFYSVQSKTVINQNAETIWNNIIEVPEISENEYEKGFFYYIGIPRPLYSKLENKNGKMYRVGYFSEGLQLYETISEQRENEFVNFKIDIENSVLRDTPTDQHVLKGNYFKFENISYQLNPIDQNQTELILTCDYKVTSKMNFYADFWAEKIIKDFEIRLLQVLKNKLE
ncbi:MAG: hypothetical protein WCY89_06250 [Flavobacteriaceae bacterium]